MTYLYLILISFLPFYPIDFSLVVELQSINDLLTEIDNGKETITQELVYDENTPFDIQLVQKTTKQKDGKEKEEVYLFNLGLMAADNVELKTSKKELSVILKSKRGKFVNLITDGKDKGYGNEVKIYFDDIDVAREVKELLESAIPSAAEEWESSINLPEELAELQTWVSERISNVNYEKKTIIQDLSSHDEYEDYMILAANKNKKDDFTYFVGLGDLNPKSMKIKTGKEVVLAIKTEKNRKTILQSGKGKTGFTNTVEFYFETPTEALELSKAIEKMSSHALEIRDTRIESYGFCDNCLEDVAAAINSYSGEKSITSNATCNAEIEVTDKKGKKISYAFNWGDLDVRKMKESYGSGELTLKIETNQKQKFIIEHKEGELSGYNNKIEIPFSDLEFFRSFSPRIEQVIESCSPDITEQDMEYISETIEAASTEKLSQVLAMESDCKMLLSETINEGKKSMDYEINLYDLDKSKVELSISKNALKLNLRTKGKEKVIATTDHDGKSEFTEKFSLVFDNLQTARNAQITLENKINTCDN